MAGLKQYAVLESGVIKPFFILWRTLRWNESDPFINIAALEGSTRETSCCSRKVPRDRGSKDQFRRQELLLWQQFMQIEGSFELLYQITQGIK